MKTALLLLSTLVFTTAAVLAHPGKTDAKGWHTDSKTGERHQHAKPDAKKPEAKKPVVKKPEAKKPEAKKKK
jgi:hypothetical protein